MVRNSVEQSRDTSRSTFQKDDSPQIANLIEQLERDLKQTRKNGAKER